MITLGTVTLPPYLLWEDEFTWSAVAQGAEYFLAGSLDIQASTMLAGRPITLVGDTNRGWITRATLLDLYALTNTPQELTLNYHDREFTVRFNHANGKPVSAVPLVKRIPPKDTDKYHSLVIRLMEVG